MLRFALAWMPEVSGYYEQKRDIINARVNPTHSMDELDQLWGRIERGEAPATLITPITKVIRSRLNEHQDALGIGEKFTSAKQSQI
ncbi:hypothetical protein [Burkholderia sp. Ax-1724]|uniref:hypothetical protein n=1 Tax=Burkholderia sp. Ax-1724 TaxID=2608336 RepID=UPI00141E5FC0|nr:hypothetical protein [Burkholderia sp. Ax-1724]NIF52494.1 hypothetical protein [Burkholderia sp. Ax-1724]